jgi:signal transduction histidine kinase
VAESGLPSLLSLGNPGAYFVAEEERSRDTGGTGLGLAIVKAIVEAHGEHVEASSADKGLRSTFTVVLPFGSSL